MVWRSVWFVFTLRIAMSSAGMCAESLNVTSRSELLQRLRHRLDSDQASARLQSVSARVRATIAGNIPVISYVSLGPS